MLCNKCGFKGNPTLEETGPHTKATCRKCGAYIKMLSLTERSNLMNPKSIKIAASGKKYISTSAMIKAAIDAGFTHVGGRGLACRNCKDKYSARKFLKDKRATYACAKCGARW